MDTWLAWKSLYNGKTSSHLDEFAWKVQLTKKHLACVAEIPNCLYHGMPPEIMMTSTEVPNPGKATKLCSLLWREALHSPYFVSFCSIDTSAPLKIPFWTKEATSSDACIIPSIVFYTPTNDEWSKWFKSFEASRFCWGNYSAKICMQCRPADAWPAIRARCHAIGWDDW